MRIRTPIDLGAVIRDRRMNLGLNQKTLATQVGVSRQWIVDVEKGKPRAPISLVLRTVEALGITWQPMIREKRRSGQARLRSILTRSSFPRVRNENDYGTDRHSGRERNGTHRP
jgi:y4mF family transcriptional regulator